VQVVAEACQVRVIRLNTRLISAAVSGISPGSLGGRSPREVGGRAGAWDYCGCAATIATVHEFSSRRSNSLVPFGRVGHRDAIEET